LLAHLLQFKLHATPHGCEQAVNYFVTELLLNTPALGTVIVCVVTFC
jgi:hypothetical protein